MSDSGDITRLLQLWRDGNEDAENELFDRVTPKLRRLASYMLKGERKGHSLESVELVNDIYIKMVAAKNRDWRSRQHFFAIAARAMRRHLIDLARKRPKVEFVPIDEIRDLLRANSAKLDLVLTLDGLLDKLVKVKPELCLVVELKIFLQMTDVEASEILGLGLHTTQRRWLHAKNWLFEQMESRSVEQSA